MSTITPTPPTPPVPPTTAVAAEVPWRRLNTRMLIVHPIQELIRFIPGIAALFFAGNTTSGHGELWGLFGAVLTVCLGLVRWFTTTYRVTSDQVQLRRGLLQRRLLTAPLDRVRTVDVTANALHRVLGLARVSVGTGQSDRKEQALRLDALSAAEAEQLAGELLHRRSMTPVPMAGEAAAAPPSPA
ncbi:MAG: PH domain-containing protein, partial [Candidatus Dormiibacterota bacterium]